jgi:2-dehydropantoate 2-reductase
MKILILGAGGIGGYFGGRLAQAGADVSFLVRPRRAAQLAARGLVVKSPYGDFVQPVRTVESAAAAGPCDLVLLTCKAYDLAAAIDAIAPAVGPDTAVLPVLNGIAHMDTLDARFGRNRVLGGLCHIATTLTPEGEVHHLNKLHALTLGERDACESQRCQTFAALMASATAVCRVSENVTLDLWEKFCFLATLAGMTCLMRGSVGDILRADDGEALMLEMLAECNVVARAAGFEPRAEATQRSRTMLTERGSSFTASMLRDMERSGPTEADHIVGDMLRRARAAGLATPLLRTAWVHLQTYELRRQTG